MFGKVAKVLNMLFFPRFLGVSGVAYSCLFGFGRFRRFCVSCFCFHLLRFIFCCFAFVSVLLLDCFWGCSCFVFGVCLFFFILSLFLFVLFVCVGVFLLFFVFFLSYWIPFVLCVCWSGLGVVLILIFWACLFVFVFCIFVIVSFCFP